MEQFLSVLLGVITVIVIMGMFRVQYRLHDQAKIDAGQKPGLLAGAELATAEHKAGLTVWHDADCAECANVPKPVMRSLDNQGHATYYPPVTKKVDYRHPGRPR